MGNHSSEANVATRARAIAAASASVTGSSSGDAVKAGQVLAALDSENTLGALTEAKAAYQNAQANYDKIINGATGTAIDVGKAAVNTAQVNLDGITKSAASARCGNK